MKKLKLILGSKVYVALFLIVIFSFVLRVYKIDSVPPSLTWDETAVGYNAYTVANWGKDEYGKTFPLYFKSFGEDKQPVHIYTTAIFVKLFGPSEFSVRVSSAVFGTMNILIIFFLAGILFKNNFISLIASFFLGISPQNIFFSRFNHEANFALFFLMLGLYLFIKMAREEKRYLLPFSFLSFILSSVSYHAAEIVTPLVVVMLLFLYFKDIFKNKKSIWATGLLLAGFIILCLVNPRILGFERYNQTKQGSGNIEKTETFKRTNNYFLGQIDLTFNQYFLHFSSKYLFESGDKNPRLSAQKIGEFYNIDAIFLILGCIYLIVKKSKEGLLVFSWALLGPLPSSLFAEAPHAGRAAFMMGSWHLVAALGFFFLINLLKINYFKWITGTFFVIVLFISLGNYLNYYFKEFPKIYAIDWQYGMKQIVEYVKSHPEYEQVFMTETRSQPYIFFLFYLRTPLPGLLNTVTYNRSGSRSSSAVAYFDKYYFSGWDPIESIPNKGALYILTPSEYDGLKYKANFETKKVIYYPNGTTAFFLVTAK